MLTSRKWLVNTIVQEHFLALPFKKTSERVQCFELDMLFVISFWHVFGHSDCKCLFSLEVHVHTLLSTSEKPIASKTLLTILTSIYMYINYI